MLVAFTATGICLSVGLGHWPAPRAHDEHAYLLLSDTFAHGRLTNPTHPLPAAFESPYLIFSPTYSSKYPPASSLFMAIGQRLFGVPLVGVWLGFALASLATLWMLRAWLPPRWALVGALLATAHVHIAAAPIFSWSNTYWGGSIAMLGGALLFGAMRRVMRRPSIVDSMLLGVGLVLMANTRPFEGLIASLFAAAALLAWLIGSNRFSLGRVLLTLVLPTCVPLVAGALLMGVYNRAVTGSALRMPYMHHEEIYGVAPLFLWQSPKPAKQIENPRLSEYQNFWAVRQYTRQQTLEGYWEGFERKWSWIYRFYLPLFWFYLVPLIPFTWTNRWALFASSTILLTLGVGALCTWFLPHYVAPLVPLWFFLVTSLFRKAYVAFRESKLGRAVTIGVIVLVMMTQAMVLPLGPDKRDRFNWERERCRRYFESQPGRHLVIVRYRPGDDIDDEWVYNGADLFGDKVLWAHDLGREPNAELMRYYFDRTTWLVVPSGDDGRLEVTKEYTPWKPTSLQ
ncbi:hypothetical protein [Planctomycetes bacterium Pan216]|uniref:hypothetical protein n=1 Tax=Kolteria novifilia TaxID=2527975 RepID=UPI0011A64F3E